MGYKSLRKEIVVCFVHQLAVSYQMTKFEKGINLRESTEPVDDPKLATDTGGFFFVPSLIEREPRSTRLSPLASIEPPLLEPADRVLLGVPRVIFVGDAIGRTGGYNAAVFKFGGGA